MEEERDFAELVDESMKPPDRENVFKGVVVGIDRDDVFIDFGSKSEGVVPKSEFYDTSGGLDVKVGEEVEVVLDRWVSDGPPRLSKTKARLIRENEVIRNAFEKGELIKAKVIRQVKGGLIADVGNETEIKAFVPGSQLDVRPQKNLDRFVGQTLEARIIKLVGDDIVLSRRVYLEEERNKLKKETLSTIEEEKVVSGKVVNIINQGVFVDIGGIEGFVPISELCWGRIKHPSQVISIDDEINVSVLKIEGEEKITLSLKKMLPDPWKSAKEKYKTGTRVKAKAVSIMNFGVFVELEPGIEGLIHISEIAWTKKLRHPKDAVEIGNVLDAIVLTVDYESRKMSLSLRRIMPSPWQVFKEDNPPGSRVKGKIRNVTDIGVFVEVAEDVVGLLRPDNVSWGERVNPEGLFKIGDEIEVVVLNIEVEKERVGLGVKQLTKDPWKDAQDRYKPGRTVVTGKIKDVKDRGLVVELENKVEGYIHQSELSREGQRIDVAKNFNVGDEITAQFIGFDKRKRQVNLSKSKYDEQLERERISKFVSSTDEHTLKLGDVLGERLKSITNNKAE